MRQKKYIRVRSDTPQCEMKAGYKYVIIRVHPPKMQMQAARVYTFVPRLRKDDTELKHIFFFPRYRRYSALYVVYFNAPTHISLPEFLARRRNVSSDVNCERHASTST